jgi:hypothetical protein
VAREDRTPAGEGQAPVVAPVWRRLLVDVDYLALGLVVAWLYGAVEVRLT